MEYSDKRYLGKIEDLTKKQKKDISSIKSSIVDGKFHVVAQDIQGSVFALFVRTDFAVDKEATSKRIDKQLKESGLNSIQDYIKLVQDIDTIDEPINSEGSEQEEQNNSLERKKEKKEKKEKPTIDFSDVSVDVYIVDYAKLACAIAIVNSERLLKAGF